MSYQEQSLILSDYTGQISRYTDSLDSYKKGSTKFSLIRLAIVVIAVPLFYFLSTMGIVAITIGIVVVIVSFTLAVMKQQYFDEMVKNHETLIAINENEINGINSFKNTYYNGELFEEGHHLYTDDLDIFGPNSLYGLINRAKTYNGIHRLANYFLELPTVEQFEERQLAVKELESKTNWRHDFAGTFYDLEQGETRDLATEIDKELQLDLSFATKTGLTAYRNLLPLLWLGVIALYFVDITLANFVGGGLFLGNLLFAMRKATEVSVVQGHLSQASQLLRSYAKSLKIIFEENWTSKLLSDQVVEFRGQAESENTVGMLDELGSIIDHLDYRLNFIPAIILNGLVLWDYRVLFRLSKWKAKHEGEMIKLFEFVGEIEALSSLGNWAFNNPQYNYPRIGEDYFELHGTELRHPLISPKDNVANNFIINQEQHLSIITGSNMSGKSTLLRTIGINMILGYTGTKVGAGALSMPIVTLISYMRIKDILEESVSTFKAELNRIDMILKMLQKGSKCFILIDEMLRGTNSKDKLAGSIGIAKRLLHEKTYAMIATHDIKLAELGNEIESGIANYYFDIDYADGDLVFDYKVKEGICQNFNASFLLNQLGIKLE